MGVGADLTDEDLRYERDSDINHRDTILALQRKERDQQGAKAVQGQGVAKWIGFNETGGPEARDPSGIHTDEPEYYMRHVKEQERLSKISRTGKPHHADENTTE